MRIFPGNFFHGEGFRNDCWTGIFFIQLLIMDTHIRISMCQIYYNTTIQIWSNYRKGYERLLFSS